MISIREIQPTGVFKNPESGLTELVENLLIRTFFEPHIKDKIGWIGVSYRSGQKRSWTFRIQKQKGVYCLTYLGFKRNRYYSTGIFNLQYFPDVSERILDFFSMGENFIRLAPEFQHWIRKQPHDTDPLEYAFTIGKILLTTESDEQALFLSFLAPVRWSTTQRDGLFLPDKNGTPIQVLPPGALDRNVPSFKLGWKFFDKLVLTFSYHLKDGPSYLFLKKRFSHGIEILKNGKNIPSQKHWIREYMLTAGFCQKKTESKLNSHVRFFKDYFPILDFHTIKESTKIIWLLCELQAPHKIDPLWWDINKWTDTVHGKEITSYAIGYRPSLHIFTGFLGSGKTTIINRIAEYFSLQRNRFVAIIQNEIGTVDIDSALIDGALNITALNDGCVCCSLRGELRFAVREVCIQYNPDMIIIETTGIADPASIIKEIPALSSYARFDSLITVVDGKNLKKILEEYPVTQSQIAHANLIILNKIDLLTDEEKEFAEKMLAMLNKKAHILKSYCDEINPSILLSLDENIDDFQGEEDSKYLLKEKDTGSHHAESFSIASFSLQGSFNKKGFLNFLNQLPDSIYRAKGVVRIDGYKEPLLMQYVGGHYELTEFQDTTVEPNSIVFIGRGFDKVVLENTLKTLLNL